MFSFVLIFFLCWFFVVVDVFAWWYAGFFHWWQLPTVWSFSCCELQLLFRNTNLWNWFWNHIPLWELDSLAWAVLWRNSGWSRTLWSHPMQTRHKLFPKPWYTSCANIQLSFTFFLAVAIYCEEASCLLIWKFMFLFLSNSFYCDSTLFHLLQKETPQERPTVSAHPGKCQIASLESNNLAVVAIASCLYRGTHSLRT